MTRKARMAPCGGERPTGSSSRTRSRSAARIELTHLGWNANRERRLSRRAGHDDCRARPSDRSRARARCGRAHRVARSPTTNRRGRVRAHRPGRRMPRRHGGDCGGDHDEGDDDRGRPHGIGERDPDAGGEDEQRRPAALDDARDHGETRSRSCSTRAGPMPGIASRSSTERKPPWAVAVVDDLLGRHGPDARKRVELLDRGRAQARTSRRRLPDTAGDAARHEHLRPVGKRRREIDRGGVGRRGRSARTGDRVSDSFALGQPVQPGPPNRACDVDDELGRSRLLGNERGGRLNRGRARTGQRAPGDREEGERHRGENERPLARHGQGGHVPSVPGEPSRRANASVPTLCPIF